MLRLLTIVACGTRTIIDAVFGSYRIGETTYPPQLLRRLKPDMLLLADRNVATLVEQIHSTEAQLLIGCKDARVLPPITHLPDHAWPARMGSVTVRVIDAAIGVRLGTAATRCGHYRLITTLSDERQYPAQELVALYHHRWEIETSYLELKSPIGGGPVLRAATPAGVTQEVYALLITYQTLRTAIADTTLTRPDIRPDRLSFTIALPATRDQVHPLRRSDHGHHRRPDRPYRTSRLQPAPAHRRSRCSPRVVKRTTYTTTITIEILDG